MSVNTEALPCEIWSRILRCATSLPSKYISLEAEDVLSCSKDTHGILMYNHYRTSMDTKLSLCLVSRFWNTLIQELMCEHLVINDVAQLPLLCDYLETQLPGTTHGRGWYTLRVDIAMDGVQLWNQLQVNAMARILQKCVNIVCFSTVYSTVRPWEYQHPDWICTLRTHLTLRRLELISDAPNIAHFFDSTSQRIQVLWLISPQRITKVDSKRKHIFPNLRLLVTDGRVGEFIRHMPLPSAYIHYTYRGATSGQAVTLAQFRGAKCNLMEPESLYLNYVELSWLSLDLHGSHMKELRMVKTIVIYNVLPGRFTTILNQNFDRFFEPGVFPLLNLIRLQLPNEVGSISEPNFDTNSRMVWQQMLTRCTCNEEHCGGGAPKCFPGEWKTIDEKELGWVLIKRPVQ